jgi:hypothetical protein
MAVVPIYALRLACRSKTHRATEAPTFELVGRAAYDLILHQSARSDIYDGLSRADVFMHQPEARPITLEKLAR